MYSTVTNRDGITYHVAIVPARDSPINLRGDHSSRGGTNALTLFSEDRPTRDRLKYPLLRLGDAFRPIPWEEAIQIVAGVVKGVNDRYGPEQLTAKVSDHGGANGGFEFTYSTGKPDVYRLRDDQRGDSQPPGVQLRSLGQPRPGRPRTALHRRRRAALRHAGVVGCELV